MSNNICKASREKYWEELETEKEQIERLRRELKSVRSILSRLSYELGELKVHMHLPSGELIKKIDIDRPYIRPFSDDKSL